MSESLVSKISLTSPQAVGLSMSCLDVMILLSPDNRVEDMHCAPDLLRLGLECWIGTALQDHVTKDSEKKLGKLFQDNGADFGNGARWRHINFVVEGYSDLPLLTKYFCFSNAPEEVRLICGRDLSPLTSAQAEFQKILAELNDFNMH